MQKLTRLELKSFILFLIALLIIPFSQAQSFHRIDPGKDTISKTDVIGARNTYLNNLRGFGKKATERINLPVDKLKEIMDACAANNITDISVIVITLRQTDLPHFRQHNPSASDADLLGSQMLVFRIPRRAFAGAMGAKSSGSNSNPLMMSLLSSGLFLLDAPYADLPWGSDDLFFSFGGICPPPTSCD